MIADLHFGVRARVRLVRQTELAECGLASLAMIAEFHGLEVDLATLRRQFAPSLRGAALKTLIVVADRLGFSSRAVKLPLSDLANLLMPAILHWDMNHYVVLEQVKGRRALIHDPAGSSRWYALEEVSRRFTGVAMELRPANDFRPSDLRQRLRLRQLWARMTGLKRALAQTLVLSVVMQAFVLASPYFMQIAIDNVLPALDYDLLTVLALGFALFACINAGASMLRSLVLLSAGASLGFGIAVNLARRLFRLPVPWFERRHVGDILSRFQSITPIQQALTQGAIGVLIDGVLAVLIFAVMLFYSPALSLIAAVAFGLYMIVRTASFAAQHLAQEDAIITAASEHSMMIESIRGITTLRLFNRESTRHAHWQRRMADAVNASIRLARVGIWQQSAYALIFGLETIATGWLAIKFVINGGFSLGMVFAYVAYKTQFLTRAASLVDQGVAFKMLSLHLDRLSDIALEDQDPSFEQPLLPAGRLHGCVELKNISFRYSTSDPLVLQDVSLLVQPGEHVAITGPSGGGKSTLVKIILGLIEPESGELLVDGVPLSRFGHKNYHDQLSAVLQEDHLFAGTIADNIGLFEEAPDQGRIVVAAEAAAIHADIMNMPMQYETLVGDMGASLSGGQKQRVLLARAFYREPRLLVVDEGTAHLDAATEAQVNAAVASLGITRIIIAHRKETISHAERRLYLGQDGRISELDTVM